MPHSHDRSVAATAQLEGWRPPVGAALQPVLVLDDALRVVAASPAAMRLVLAEPGRPLAEALGLRDLAPDWTTTPFAQAIAAGEPQRARVELSTPGLSLDVVVNPLFGPGGVIGALVFLTSA